MSDFKKGLAVFVLLTFFCGFCYNLGFFGSFIVFGFTGLLVWCVDTLCEDQENNDE